ncbi:MAG TPA: flagellar biosynthetic protein FliO [bacterium]|nr:flagellar biosynthetic protein FliO [bacterium]
MSRRLITWMLVLLLGAAAGVPAMAGSGGTSGEGDGTGYTLEEDPREQRPVFPESGDEADGSVEPAGSRADVPRFDFGLFLLNVIVWLVICVALIYGLVLLLKLFYRRFPGGAQSPMLETLASVAVAPGVAIHLVRLHDTVLILGATSGSVTLIEKVTDPDRVALLVQGFTPRPPRPNPRSFGEVLTRTQRQMARASGRRTDADTLLARAELGGAQQQDPRMWVVGDGPEIPVPESREGKLEALRQAIRDVQATEQ